MTKPQANRFAILTAAALSIPSSVLLFAPTAGAESIIKQPGNHPHYSWELEPHMALDWDGHHELNSGFGPGVHVAIPIMHQGPITTINNNMAIKFGMDLTFHDCNRGYWGNWNNYQYDCSATSILLPVALQWNFYLTDIITVYGEPGIAIRHYWSSQEFPGGNCPGGICTWHNSETYALPYFGMGAKFMFGRSAGLNVRLGYPHATIGASILF